MKDHWRKLLAELNYKDGEKIIDIGGAYDPIPIADEVVDIVDLGKGGKHYTILDLTCHALPFGDNAFDIAVCSQTLEDLTSPTLVLHEMSRVAKRGIIEVPHRGIESIVKNYSEDGKVWCYGVGHHKWLVEEKNNILLFTVKSQLRLCQFPIPRWNGPKSIRHKWLNNIGFGIAYDIDDRKIEKNYRQFKENNRRYWEF